MNVPRAGTECRLPSGAQRFCNGVGRVRGRSLGWGGMAEQRSMEIIEQSSPNFGPRRGTARPDLVVIHYTAMESCVAALRRLCDPAAEVSAHYLVGETGLVWRLVQENARAWHAGQGEWGDVADVNSRSIGIELANRGPLAGFPPFPDPQIRALESLLDAVMAAWAIPADRIIAHSDVAPGRKADPGPKFDWRRLALGGRAVWAEAGSGQESGWPAFGDAARRFGYRPPAGNWAAVLAAFRLRFRPGATGVEPDALDVGLLQALVRR